MKNIFKKSVLTFLASATLIAIPVNAIDNGGPVDTAKKNKIIGEMATGYLGFVRTPTQDQIELNRTINEINARRKAYYSDVAAKNGGTLKAAEITAARMQIKERTAIGEYFRDSSDAWCLKTEKSIIEAKEDGSIIIQCAK